MKNEPLGLPRGSVRSILAVIIVTTICVVAGKLAWFGDKDGLIALAGLANSAVTFYFLQRSQQTNGSNPPPPDNFQPRGER